MALIACKFCGKTISSSAKKCPHCGSELETEAEIKARLTCPECGANTDDITSSCPHCGHPFVITPIRIRTYAIGGEPTIFGVEALGPTGQMKVALFNRVARGKHTFQGAFACTFSALRFYYHEWGDIKHRSVEVTVRCSNCETGLAFEIDQRFDNFFAMSQGKYCLDIEEVPFGSIAPDKETLILNSTDS